MWWNSFLELLNLYGGLVGLISLAISIFISVTTGNIKRDMIQAREIREYKKDKRAAVRRFQEIAGSIKYDQIYDNAIKTELLVEINKIRKYGSLTDAHCKWYIWRINHILDSDSINSRNCAKIVSLVAKLCGRMSVEPVSKEVG